jgi:hypothetical protein
MMGYYTGPSLPHPPSSDSNEDSEMDFDDHRDFMDQDDPAEKFTTVDPGPIHQFLSGIPDWLNFNPEDLDRAMDRGERGNDRPGFGVHSVTQKLSAYYIIRVFKKL